MVKKKKKSLIKLYIILRAGVKAPHSYVKVLHMDRTTQKGLRKELKQVQGRSLYKYFSQTEQRPPTIH